MSSSSGPATLSISPRDLLHSEPVEILIHGLRPEQEVEILARQIDSEGMQWISNAVFRADSRGTVDPRSQAPESGTYEGIDPAGLFWSMRPEPDTGLWAPANPDLGPETLLIRAKLDGEGVLEEKVVRRYLLPGVKRLSVGDQRVVGTLFLPETDSQRPALIFLGGSEGGIREDMAAIFASCGYVTLALGYFRAKGLPAELVEVPLETVGNAVRYLNNRSEVKPGGLGIYGVSKGAELALLAASRYPDIRAVVANCPSSVVFQGISSGEDQRSSWSEKNKPLPFVPLGFTGPEDPVAISFQRSMQEGIPWSSLPMYQRGLDESAEARAGAIPVKQIDGPVLLLSAGQDGVWPSGRMAEEIMAHLRDRGHPFPDQHLHYPGSGHMIRTPWKPEMSTTIRLPGGFAADLGGKPYENAHAAEDSWPRIHRFLDRALVSAYLDIS